MTMTTAQLQAARAVLYAGERAMPNNSWQKNDAALQYHVSREPAVLQRYEVRSLAVAMASGSGPAAPAQTDVIERVTVEYASGRKEMLR